MMRHKYWQQRNSTNLKIQNKQTPPIGSLQTLFTFKKTIKVSLQPGTINHPNHVFIKLFPLILLIRIDRGMLKFYDKTMFGMHIGNMFFTGSFIFKNKLLPTCVEMVFPLTVPFGLAFKP